PAKAAMPAQRQRAEAALDDIVLQRVDEEIDIETRRYNAGKVHVATRIAREQVARDVNLHEERVTVDRSKVDRPLDRASADRSFRDQTLEVTSKAEVPLVCKNAHVVEEIVIKKDARDRDQTVHDSVRHMDIEITELRADEALKGAKR